MSQNEFNDRNTGFQKRLNISLLKHESKKVHNDIRNKMYKVSKRSHTSSLANYSISNNQEIYVAGDNLTQTPFSL
jgi:hypothetical protein